MADGFGLSWNPPWGAVAPVGARTLAVSDSLLGGVITLLQFQDTTLARQTLPAGFSSPVSVGGAWPQAWVAARFDFARQNGQTWQTRKLAFPRETDELLAARSWLGGRVLGLFVPGDRFSGANLRGGVFAVVDGPAGGEPDLHAPSCQDCRSIFVLDFAALPTGQVYVVGERDGQLTLLEFLPTGGRGIYVPTTSFEPLGASYGPSGRIIALSWQEIYFGAGHGLPIVYRYDGTKVEALPTPPDLPATVEAARAAPSLTPVMGLAARPGGDLWAIFGTRSGYPAPGVPRSRLYRYDRAGTWESESLPPGPDGRAPSIVDVAVSNDGLWVLGQFDDHGVLYRSALPASSGPPPSAPPVAAAGNALSYGAVSGAFICGGVTCSGQQVCCEFNRFQRCVTPNAPLPADVAGFAKAAPELVKACRVDDFDEPSWQVDVCTASSDCAAGQLCVSPETSSRTAVAYCAASMPPNSTELCQEGRPCAEPGSICQQSECVRASAKVDCAMQTCRTGQVCCPDGRSSYPWVISCLKLEQCAATNPDYPRTLPCTSRQQCTNGRRCVLGDSSGHCRDLTDLDGWDGFLCATDSECDLLKCAGAGRARCARQTESKLKVCTCPNGKLQP